MKNSVDLEVDSASVDNTHRIASLVCFTTELDE